MLNRKLIAIAFSLCVVGFLPTLSAQQGSQQNSQNGQQGSGPSSPGAGITSGTIPIEATLFAYRSLASDADAISREILALGMKDRKVVIGTAADVAAFAQWREIMAEATLLDERAKKIHSDFPKELPRNGQPSPVPYAFMVSEAHLPAAFTPRDNAQVTLVVTNISGAVGAPVPLVLVDTLPNDWTIQSPNVPDWMCNVPTQSTLLCTRNAALPPNSASIIAFNVMAGNPPPAGAPPAQETVNLTGGGSAAAAPVVIPLNFVPAIGLRAAQLGAAPSSTTTSGGGSGALGALTGAIPVFATLLNEAFAVTQTISSSQGTMTDAPLITMTAERLQQAGVSAFVPSGYIPNLFRSGTLQDTYLWRKLVKLEADRAQLWRDIATANEELAKDTYITQHTTNYTASDFTTSLEYSGRLQSLTMSAQAVATSIDTFEITLFGGQAVTPSQQQTQNQQPQNPNANNPNPNANNPNLNAGNSPGGNGNGSGNGNGTPSNGSNSAVPQQTVPANVLPQILGADLLAQALWKSDPGQEPDGSAILEQLSSVDLLTVHSLESGGSELTKSNFFFGSRILFGGGAVTNFTLYKASGEVECSGLAYDYEGNAKVKNYDRTLRLSQLPAIVTTDYSSCRPASVTKPQVTLRVGMTATEAFAAANVPYRAINARGKTYTFELQDADDTRLVVRDGAVVKVMKKPK